MQKTVSRLVWLDIACCIAGVFVGLVGGAQLLSEHNLIGGSGLIGMGLFATMALYVHLHVRQH